MGIGKWVGRAILGGGGASGLVEQAASVAKEYIEDPDLRNKIISEIIKADTELKIERTKAKTIPWVDALHKMSRVILAAMLMTVYLVLKLRGIDVELTELVTVAAPAGLYTVMKGRGK